MSLKLTAASFNPDSSHYQTKTLERTNEVQQITTYYRAGDDVVTRSGTFTVSWGGKTSAALNYNIAAFDLETTLNNLANTRDVSVAPIKVSRMAWNRGYKWLITFEGIHGDVGLIQVNGEKLVGDDVRISSTEVVKGDGDIIPGDFTYEVQVVHTEATQAIGSSSSTFTLEVEGYVTEALNYNAEYFEVKDALEKLPTIYTAAVTREAKDATLHTYAWTVTFTHTKREVVQGSGEHRTYDCHIELDCTCDSTTCCSVEVFESVKGTHPKHFEITSLSPATAYYTRVTAYNERGYSLSSVVANKATLGQPLAPSAVVSSIKTGTSLTATWTAPTVDYSTTGYMVESFTSTPINEVQVITTSGSASLPEIQRITVDADAENIAGYFTLEFGGETTDLIAFNALAEGTDSVAQSPCQALNNGPC